MKSSGIRLFSSVRARLPDKLVKNLEQNFGGTGKEDFRCLMNKKMSLDSADKVFEFLNHEIKRGCDQSLRFAQALTTVRQQDSYTGLFYKMLQQILVWRSIFLMRLLV